MYYIVPTSKNAADAARDLTASVEKHEFGVLHVHPETNAVVSDGCRSGRLRRRDGVLRFRFAPVRS